MSRPTFEAPRTFTVERRLPVAPDAVADARRAIEELVGIIDDDVVDSARLLISELVTNAVRHGPHGGADAIVLSVDHDGRRLRVEVRDDGDGFVLPARGDRDVGGWGLVLVEQLSDRWRIEIGSPTRVWFEIDTDPAAGRWPATIDSLLLEIERAAVIATDLDGVVTRWNRHATELYGHEARDAIGRNVVELIVRAGDERSVRSIESRLRTGEAWEGEWLAARRDGSSVWVRVATSPVVDLSGDMLGMLAVSVDVTERRAAQRALVESEERLRIALESGRMGTWDWDVASGRVTWSESLERIHGLEPGSFGGTFEDLQRDLHPEDRARVLGSIERALHDGASYVLDHRITVPGGGVRWLSVHGRVLRDDDGRATAPVGVAADHTERKEAERALAVQYSVSRALATATTLASATTPLLRGVGEELGWEVGGIWRVDADGRALRFVGGWQLDDAVGARIVAASQTLRLERGRGLPGRILATGRPLWLDDFSERMRFPRADAAVADGLRAAFGFPITLGDEVLGVVEFFSRRIRDPDESQLDLMAAIGAQVGQFVERTQTQVELAESEARKSAVFESALEGIVTMDVHGHILELNPAAAEMFGYERDAVVGRELAEVFVPPSYRSRHRDALERYRRTGRGRILGRRLELVGMRSDGTEFPIELAVNRVALPDADETLFTGTVRDITPRRRADELQAVLFESERAAREQIERAHERVAFLADASELLGHSLDVATTLGALARLVVPRLADWCAVDVARPSGEIEAVAVAHVDVERRKLAEDLRRRWPSRVGDGGAVDLVIERGEPTIVPNVTPEMIDATVLEPERRAIVRELGLRSIMIVPLAARGRTVGAITFASAESERVFGDDDLELAQDLARRAALAYDNARLYEERSHIAQTLQNTLLPRELPSIDGVEIVPFYQPSNISHADVGGDFYDVFETADGTWALVVGDVCGKGVEAAALTGMARHTLRATGTRGGSPVDALQDLNRVMIREDGERFCTVAFGRLRANGRGAYLDVACGGHPSPLVVRADGRVETVGAPGSLLGVFDDVQFEERSTLLERGDLAIFFTDGLIDARASAALDEVGLATLVARCAGRSAEEALEVIKAVVADPEASTSDDTCVLVVRVGG